METEIIKMACQTGIFASLFVYLFFYMLKDSKAREVKYQETINKNQEIINDLAKQFNVMKDVKEDVEQIKAYIFK